MMMEKANGSFSRVHESLKSITTLRLIFGARIVATPRNRVLSYSWPLNKGFSSYRFPLLFQVFICTRETVVTVKIKSLSWYIPRNSFFHVYSCCPFCTASIRASIDILALMQQMHPEYIPTRINYSFEKSHIAFITSIYYLHFASNKE